LSSARKKNLSLLVEIECTTKRYSLEKLGSFEEEEGTRRNGV